MARAITSKLVVKNSVLPTAATNIIISTIYNLTCSSKQQVRSTDFTKLQVIGNISFTVF